MTKFKVGNKVRVITDRHTKDQKGLVGVVKTIGSGGYLPVQVTFQGKQDVGCRQNAHTNSYSEADLELVIDITIPRFVVGETVRVNKVGDKHRDQLVTIVNVNTYSCQQPDYSVRTTNGGRAWFEDDELTKVESAASSLTPQAWLVMKIVDGVFKPSTSPKPHSTQAEAVTEATRLADTHGGEYHVLKSVAAAARPVQPVTVTAFS